MKYRRPIICAFFTVVGVLGFVGGGLVLAVNSNEGLISLSVGLVSLGIGKALELLAEIAFDTKRTADHIAALHEQPAEAEETAEIP